MNTPVGTPEVKTPKVFSEMICYKVGRPTGAQSVAATFINAPLPSTLADVIARNPKVTEENFTASFVANTNADATNFYDTPKANSFCNLHVASFPLRGSAGASVIISLPWRIRMICLHCPAWRQ